MSLNHNVARTIRSWIAEWPDDPDQSMLFRVLRYLAQWRATLLANSYLRHNGAIVAAGLFEGMAYVAKSTEGALMPRLLGTYESELHEPLRSLLAVPPDQVIDVGCAEGYYAVGLARLLADTRIHAHDTDPAARIACARLAEANGVADRVTVGGPLEAADFETFGGARTLVILDVEGAEIDLLRPDLAPALKHMAIVVETHDVFRPGALAEIKARFEKTHVIEQIDEQPKQFAPPDWLRNLSQLDKLLAVWEWRQQPTPWLVMRPISGW
jgi:predicted O-methyltransferase YrrM